MAIKPFKTPCGLEIAQLNKTETEFVYKEVFVDKVYLRHGIMLKPGDCVFDVGANIGMFCVFLQEHFKGVKVHAFEPSPEIFSVLRANTSKYDDQVVAHQVGVSNQSRKATFTFYPSYSILSGFHADDSSDTQTIRAGIISQWRARFPDQPDPDERFQEALIAGALSGKVEYECQLRAITELIAESGVSEISLLKVDAEGCEVEILFGLSDNDWKRIRQIVIEIHSTNPSDLPTIRAMLDKHGYQYEIEAEKGLELSGIVNCYARKK